jgi:Flp pilus assembly protein TadD
VRGCAPKSKLNPEDIMLLYGAVAVAWLVAGMAAPSAQAADIETNSAVNAENRDYVAGKRAVEKKDWSAAAESVRKVVAKEPENGDANTMLGNSLRWQGKLDDAFVAYDQALRLDPNHRGAHEYLGIAFLKAEQPAKAEAQLARLAQISGKNADEYRELVQGISDYNAGTR